MKTVFTAALFVLAVARLTAGAVRCDATHECPTGNTCCKTSSGQWGCCPLPQAVCCSDHVHCCPNGYTCHVSTGKCEKGPNVLPWLEKKPATASSPMLWKSENVEAVKCDATHECPTGSTCCKTSSGQWGCCPLPQAVCCSDHVHCCPNGYTCHVSTGKCEKGPNVLPWLEKIPASVNTEDVPVSSPWFWKAENIEAVRCDATHECPTGNTCCKTSSGEWGCCPAPKAVCCPDHVHCCPEGYKCHTATGQCSKGFTALPWLQKTMAMTKTRPQKNMESVRCDDTFECASGQTCCKTSAGQWGCCPHPEAVCCSDGVHCCPNGYTCDVSSGQCAKDSGTLLPWVQKAPSMMSAPVQKRLESVICDDTTECPTGNTCCQLSSGQYGCCPLPQV